MSAASTTSPPDAVPAASAWANRIVGYDPAVNPEQLLAHPSNWRRHPGAQRDALRGSLEQIGWVGVVLVNTVTQHVVDGHARIEEAISAGSTVPVIYAELSPAEEAIVLATLDPIAAMATVDAEQLADLIGQLDLPTLDDGLAVVIAQLAADAHLAELAIREVAFSARDLRVVEIRCSDDQLEKIRPALDRWADEGLHVTMR